MWARIALAVVLLAISMSLSGCVYFSNAFWQCLAGLQQDSCSAATDYLNQSAADWDGDGVENGDDECAMTPYRPDTGNPGAFGCPDGDRDNVPDYRDPCPHEYAFPTGCPGVVPGGDQEPPARPSGLTADGQGSRIRLNWNDNTEPDLAGYHVARSSNLGGPYGHLTASPLTATQFDDESIDPDRIYFYVVTAVDTSGNHSERSDEVSATGCQPPECTSSPGGMARVSLTAAAGKAYSARVTGRFVRARSFRARDGVLTGRRLVFAGRLAGARGAPAGLRRGAWSARFDLTLSTVTRRATVRRGVALARFGRGGRLCLRFTQRMRVPAGGKRLLTGSFAVIGATGRARRLASASRFSGSAGPGAAWTLRASGRTGRSLPRALPRACRSVR
jgi:hypothetical protein